MAHHVKSIRVAAAAAAVGFALTACSSPVEAGAAAVVGKERIAASELNANVKEFETALQKAKITPEQLKFPGSVTQVVLYQMAQVKQYEQVLRQASVTVSEGEIDQAITASTQDPQAGPLEQQMLGRGIAPSHSREFMKITIGLQKLLAQYGGGGTDQAAQQKAGLKLQEVANTIPITYSPRYGPLSTSQESQTLFSPSTRFGTAAETPVQQPQG